MLEFKRSPGTSPLGSPTNSSSPMPLFMYRPVPVGITPDPYPADSVMAQARPSESTAETCTVDGDRMGSPGRPRRNS